MAEWTNPPAIAFTKWLDAKFEKAHPGVSVKLEDAPTSSNAYTTLTTTMLQSKSVDVLAQFAPTPAGFPPSYTGQAPAGTAAMITSHQLTDLTDEPFMKHYDLTQQQFGIGYKGHVYGVMAAAYEWAGALWYKKDLLAKYHLSLPTTLDQFIADCKTLKSHGITPIFVAGKDDMQDETWIGMVEQLMMQGHPSSASPAVSAANAKAFWDGSASWTDPLYKVATQRYEQVMHYIEPAASGVSQLTAPGVWAANSSNYAFLVDGSWDGKTIQQANPKLKFGFFTLPGTNQPQANRTSINANLSWVVPVWAKQKKLAMEWLSMFSQPANYQQWLQATGAFSTQPGLRATGLPWMGWLNANQASGYLEPQAPWVPTGAAPDAGGPDLTKMLPFGSQSVNNALSHAAMDYTTARKKAK